MKKMITKKSGFTLIEIIVVLIIVGVLAAIALPNLFGNVARSRGAEALASMGAIKTQVEGCLQGNNGFVSVSGCTFAAASSPNFQFIVANIAASIMDIQATNAVGTIMLSRGAGVAGTWVCSGTGAYAGIC